MRMIEQDDKRIIWEYKEKWRRVRLDLIIWRRRNPERAYPKRYNKDP